MADPLRPRRVPLFNFQAVLQSITGPARSRALDSLAEEMTEALKSKIDTPYPPASKPRRPPHQRTPDPGGLHGMVTVARKGNSLFVRVPQYGVWLEGGTSRMEERPFIAPTLEKRIEHWRDRLRTFLKRESRGAARRLR